MSKLRTLQSRGGGEGALGARIAELGPWFHNLHLPGGRQTAPDHPLGDFPAFKWHTLAPHLPADLHGARALDIGCNAGFYSFELARRGADVLGVDHDPHYLRQARWAAGQLGLADRVRFEQRGVYELASLSARFDLVLFMGVFYHLRYPLLALDIVASKVAGLLVFQSLSLRGHGRQQTPADVAFTEREVVEAADWPRMAFVEHEFAGDPTNWWLPDAGAMRGMLRTAGLSIAAEPLEETYLCRPSNQPAAGPAWLAATRAALGEPDNDDSG
ncbi:MAG: TIGR04290 family methyltransferase [Pseudomonadota bacterium]|nr:TIGR04290 family methyltransferase [Pseudomonadota bacterium]HJO36040.1 TIGR04290 family methyltransferase [Gammaproteobacteria bacterium]